MILQTLVSLDDDEAKDDAEDDDDDGPISIFDDPCELLEFQDNVDDADDMDLL